MVARRTAAIAWICAGLAAAAAAQPTARLRLDRNPVTQDTPFMIFIEASGNDVGEPVIPDIDGLVIEKTPRHSSSQMQVSFGAGGQQMTRTVERGYAARATRKGVIEIPPIAVPIGGKTVYTPAARVNVVAAPPPSPNRNARPPQRAQQSVPSRAGRTQMDWDHLVFTRSAVDKTEVYQGEPVRLSLEIWHVQAEGVLVPEPDWKRADFFPESEGFYAVSLTPKTRQERRDGWTYEVWEFPQLLYPTAMGELTIDAWRWQATVRAPSQSVFLAAHQYDFETDPIAVTVKPLPPGPDAFSGAVGQYTFEARLDDKEVLQGVPVTLELFITGRGNPNAIGEPPLPQMENVYVGDPEKEVRAQEDGTVVKTITHHITPLEPGTLTIPPVPFCYFDPATERFETLETRSYDVKVLASAESSRHVLVGQPLAPEETRVAVLAQDICPIVARPGRLRPRSAAPWTEGLAIGVPMLAYGGLALYMRRKRRFERDTRFARSHRALNRARKRLKEAPRAKDPCEALYRALTGFIADKFDVPEGGITAPDAARMFAERGVAREVQEPFERILRACERARYATAALSRDEVDALTDGAAMAMERLDKALHAAGAKGGGS